MVSLPIVKLPNIILRKILEVPVSIDPLTVCHPSFCGSDWDGASQRFFVAVTIALFCRFCTLFKLIALQTPHTER